MDYNEIIVFIDAGNIWSSYKELGKMINFAKLPDFLSKKFYTPIFKVFYYVAYPKEGTRTKETIDRHHKFLTYLSKGLKFQIVKKELKTIFLRDGDGNIINDESGKPKSREKGNFDVEITLDALKNLIAYNTAVFFTGDSDFLPLITYLRGLDKKVFIFSTKGCVSHELRSGADNYFDLLDCKEIHGSELVRKNSKLK